MLEFCVQISFFFSTAEKESNVTISSGIIYLLLGAIAVCLFILLVTQFVNYQRRKKVTAKKSTKLMSAI